MANNYKLPYFSEENQKALGNALGTEFQGADLSNRDWAPAYDYKVDDSLYQLEKYEAPTYTSAYGDKVQNLLSSMENRGKFSYDAASDPVYQAYRKQYLREGQRATQNTMAQASAMTGGRPSSWAVSAAAQAGNNYNAQLTDKIPELYQQAYNRYMQEFQNNAQMAQLYQTQDAQDYNRFSQERNFGYQQMQDRLNNYMTAWKNMADIRANERDFNYQVQQDRIKNLQNQQSQDWSRFYQQANLALNTGDYGMLRAMGFDTSRTGFASDFQIASLIAQYTGDTSMLRSLMGKG